jgi:hypothetical protein
VNQGAGRYLTKGGPRSASDADLRAPVMDEDVERFFEECRADGLCRDEPETFDI